MQLGEVIRRRIRHRGPGLELAADVQCAIAVNGRTRRTPEGGRQSDNREAGDTGPATVTSTRTGGTAMSDELTPKQTGELTDEELEQQAGEELPDREAMSLINANLAAPVNAAVALNALSDNSVAYADATQTAPITQTN